jgi:acyl dehydratase
MLSRLTDARRKRGKRRFPGFLLFWRFDSMPSLHIRAVNTAADSENKIHDDLVAAQFGFQGGLVPGVTVYGYLAQAVLEYFGDAWLTHGAMDVHFHQPVYDGEEVEVTTEPESSHRVRVAIAGRASGLAWLHNESVPAPPDETTLGEPREPSEGALAKGVVLGVLSRPLDLATAKMSAPLGAAIGAQRFAHPAILLALANEVFVKNYALGPWIHVSSEVRKFSTAHDGESIRVRASVEDRFERKGHQLVVLNVLIDSQDGRAIEHVRHTAIWRPRAGS